MSLYNWCHISVFYMWPCPTGSKFVLEIKILDLDGNIKFCFSKLKILTNFEDWSLCLKSKFWTWMEPLSSDFAFSLGDIGYLNNVRIKISKPTTSLHPGHHQESLWLAQRASDLQRDTDSHKILCLFSIYFYTLVAKIFGILIFGWILAEFWWKSQMNSVKLKIW